MGDSPVYRLRQNQFDRVCGKSRLRHGMSVLLHYQVLLRPSGIFQQVDAIHASRLVSCRDNGGEILSDINGEGSLHCRVPAVPDSVL